MSTEQIAENDAAVADALAESTSDASLERTRLRSQQIEGQIDSDPSRFRVLTGDRPTGNLHLGHSCGTLANRVADTVKSRIGGSSGSSSSPSGNGTSGGTMPPTPPQPEV